jgi:alpha-tubulin suppressor-like RCC1 family protein
MKLLRTVIVVATALVALFSQSASHATTRARFRAETILNDSSVRLAAGGRHTCQVNEDGSVRCWGANEVGQLGNGLLGDGIAANNPTRIPTLVLASPSNSNPLTTVVAVAAGSSHTCALLADGTVRCWGANGNGQLGNAALTNQRTPVTVITSANTPLTTVVAITAAGSHTCAVLANGSVRCWGANGSGQLGIGTAGANQLTAVTVISSSTALTNVVAVAAGGNHTCALLAIGTVRCWGANIAGELGIGSVGGNQVNPAVAVSGFSTAVAITAGGSTTCALLANGTVRCWGANGSGQLGIGASGANQATPVTVITSPNNPLINAVAITASGSHTCALLVFGTALCWGANGSGQIGDGTSGGIRATPVQVAGSFSTLENAVSITAGAVHTCALLADGSAKCWGLNTSGQLGISNTAPSNTAPTPVLGGGGSFTARDIAAGRNHTCAVRANGTVACWGSNDSGQIGDGTIGGTRLSPVTVPGLNNVVSIAAGEAHTCVVLSVGVPLCWGLNTSGQLGNGTMSTSPTPVGILGINRVVGIAAGGALGSSHTCALLADGTVRCWGANGSGQLGTGNTSPSSVPVTVPGLANVVSIAVGEFHTCALVAIGAPFCWGFNGSGRLGTSPTTNPLLPALVSLDNTVAIAVGNTHTCALRADGAPFCWGANLLGQLGINSTVSQPVPTFTNLFNAVAIAGGFGHTCAAVADGTSRCWGDNASGQLGNSTIGSSSLTPVTVGRLVGNLATFFSPIRGVVNLTTGRRHSCALFATGGLACWGENTVGQLGIGSTTNQVSPVTVPSFTVNIDPSVVLEHNDRVSTVTIVATCEAGQRLHVEVNLIQGGVSGHGIGTGECTGGLERYPVTVPAQGRNGYSDGPAQVSAVADIHEPGAIVETQEWTRAVQIGSVP